MGVRIKWRGQEAMREIEATIGRRARKAAAILVKAVQEECPVDTGDLRATVRQETEGKNKVNVVVGGGPKSIDYTRYVHDGTSRSRANPFFTRAIFRSKAAIREALAGKGDGLLARIGEFIGGLFGR